ncbi:MAG: molybdopterin synthase sulfur carrier subunit [Planctomycetaceae bacterium]|jgi:molybdopterin synthase sulfur carrier subunit
MLNASFYSSSDSGDVKIGVRWTVSVDRVRGEALRQLEQHHPAVYRSVCDETGAVRRHIHLFVNMDLLLGVNNFEAPLDPGDTLFIMPAVSGG